MDDTVFIGGPEKRAIVIEEYDPAWAARFEQVKASLAEALGPRALRIEHFGSTAVPGLGAKGIIDVLVGRRGRRRRGRLRPRARVPRLRHPRPPARAPHVPHARAGRPRARLHGRQRGARASACCSATGCATTPPTAASTRRPSARWRARSGRRRTTTPTPRAPWWRRSSCARSAGRRRGPEHPAPRVAQRPNPNLRSTDMKAVAWHGKRDVRVDTVPDPMIEEPTDAIVRITSTGICGSDLHLYEVLGPFMGEGDILGHEPMGDRRGGRRRGHQPRQGDRVVIPFNISCGHCFMCDHGPAVAVRDHPGPRPGDGRRAVRLHEALRPGARRAGRVPARAAGAVRADQGARGPAGRPLRLPLRRPPHRLAGGRVRRTSPTAAAVAVLRPRPDRGHVDAHRQAPRRRQGHRHRPRPRAPRARARERRSRCSTSPTSDDIGERCAS